MTNNTTETSYAIFDYEQFPIVYVYFQNNKITDEGLEAFLQEYDELLNKGKHLPIYVSSQSSVTSAQHRIRLGNFLKEKKEQMRESIIASSIVISTAIQRFVMNAVFFVSPFPAPHKIFKSKEDAEKWINEKLEEARKQGVIE